VPNHEQSTEIVVMRLPLAYGLNSTDLNLEPGASFKGVMDYFATNGDSMSEEVLERIFRHAIILFHSEKGSFGECLDTALIWEVG